MRRTKKIRASKDEQLQEDTLPLTQRPEFIIGMTFLGVYFVFIICVLIFFFIHRKGNETDEVTDLSPFGNTVDVDTVQATSTQTTNTMQDTYSYVWGR